MTLDVGMSFEMNRRRPERKTAAAGFSPTAAVDFAVGLCGPPGRQEPAGRDYSALTMFSTIFLASPNSIIVLFS